MPCRMSDAMTRTISSLGQFAWMSLLLVACNDVGPDGEFVGQVAQAVNICNATPAANLTVDGIPAYAQCSASNNAAIYSNNGVDTATTAVSSEWKRTQYSGGYQCTELVHRYWLFKWNVTWIPNGNAGTWCGTAPPSTSGIVQTTTPVHGDAIVFAPGTCGADAVTGHIALVDTVDMAASKVTFVEENTAGRRSGAVSCAACFLHVVANNGSAGANSTGGASAIGGSSATGGASAIGGASATASGGAPASIGGRSGTGGRLSTFTGGNTANTGGNFATGGGNATIAGGRTSTGGAVTTASGGTNVVLSGGATATGGDRQVVTAGGQSNGVGGANPTGGTLAATTSGIGSVPANTATGGIVANSDSNLPSTSQGVAPVAPPAEPDAGCSCRVVNGEAPYRGHVFAGLVLVALLHLRRRRVRKGR